MSRKMSSTRRSTRASNLGAPFACCFGGNDTVSFRISGRLDHSLVGYDRVGFEEKMAAKTKEVRVIQLGEPTSFLCSAKARKLSSLPSMMRESKGSLRSRVMGACGQVLNVARKGRPHINELFVGNQLLMQVTASSLLSRHSKSIKPSNGLLHSSFRNSDKRLLGR